MGDLLNLSMEPGRPIPIRRIESNLIRRMEVYIALIQK
jgi:hypothetical protein